MNTTNFGDEPLSNSVDFLGEVHSNNSRISEEAVILIDDLMLTTNNSEVLAFLNALKIASLDDKTYILVQLCGLGGAYCLNEGELLDIDEDDFEIYTHFIFSNKSYVDDKIVFYKHHLIVEYSVVLYENDESKRSILIEGIKYKVTKASL